MPCDSQLVAEICHLTRRFGRQTALNDLSLTVKPGFVYGLVGANGAGKTTLIRHILGLLRAEEGTVRVFGLDPVIYPVEVLQRIGYLSEDREMPEWMRIGELLRYTAAFYPRWDEPLARELLGTFQLDARKKIKELSRGMRAQVGIIAAVAHRPELLLLDEPSTGLDAIVRKDILNAIVRTVADDGRTVIFSSHLLDEVELMSDEVLMIHQGNLVVRGSVDKIRAAHQRVTVRWSQNTPFEWTEGLISSELCGDVRYLVVEGTESCVQAQLSSMQCDVLNSRTATLQEIFVARAGRSRPTPAEV